VLDRTASDNWYIKRWSLWLDLKILVRTLDERLVLDLGVVLDRVPGLALRRLEELRYSGAPGNLTLSATTIDPGCSHRWLTMRSRSAR
jgi:hypothetical protein